MLDSQTISHDCHRFGGCLWAPSDSFCRSCGAGSEPKVEAGLRINFINLDRSPERLAEFKTLNAHLTNCERFPAIDGRTLDIPTLVEKGLVTADIVRDYTIGNVGAAMSNIGLWDRAISSGQIVTAAEDDAIFNFGFERQAAEIIGRLPDDWDFILWGYDFDLFMCFQMLPGASPCLALFEQEQLRAGIRAFQTQTIPRQSLPADLGIRTNLLLHLSQGCAGVQVALLAAAAEDRSLPRNRQGATGRSQLSHRRHR